MNSVSITGRLTASPQQRTVGELQICDLRVAIPRRRGRDGEDRGAVFIDITTFGPLAKIAGRYLTKGRQVAVTGRLELDEWTGPDNSPRRRHKIVAEQVDFLDNGAPSAAGGDDADASEPAEESVDRPAAEDAQHDQPVPDEPAAA